jgi:hypothetical protein
VLVAAASGSRSRSPGRWFSTCSAAFRRRVGKEIHLIALARGRAAVALFDNAAQAIARSATRAPSLIVAGFLGFFLISGRVPTIATSPTSEARARHRALGATGSPHSFSTTWRSDWP